MHVEPIVSFAILLAVILVVPVCFERFKLPGLLGLLIAGVVLGPNGLNMLQTDSETMNLLSDIGVVYLLFVAGLEIDLEQFRATRNRSAGFGFATFAIPLITGILVGRLFGFDWNASVLIGSLFASHTLLAYPIISRLGVVNNEAVTVTIGATIFTDIGSLLVLAVCVGINQGDFSWLSLGSLLLAITIFSVGVLFGVNWLGKEVFRRSVNEEGIQFLFVLLALFAAALGAELIGVEKIVGAFLAGLAINGVIGEGPLKEKILFVGNVLFIPIFFVDIGLLINLPAFISSIGTIGLTATIVAGLIGSKFLAALVAKTLYRYSWREGITMWSLSLPQVAATLAAAFVGYREGMLTESVLNSVIVLMLVTATLGPMLTARAAAGLIPNRETLDFEDADEPAIETSELQRPTILVPVHNPTTQRHLVELAAILAHQAAGRVIPLAITKGHIRMDAPELDAAIQRSRSFLTEVIPIGQEIGATIEPMLRIDDHVAQGISRASREQQATLIVMGWGRTNVFRARLFGTLIDQVLWSAHCPVAVTRLLQSPSEIRRILVPIELPNQAAWQSVRFAEILATANQAEVLLLHVSSPRTSPERMAWLKAGLNNLTTHANVSIAPKVETVSADDVAGTIARWSRSFDLVVLRTPRRRRGSFGDLTLGSMTVPIVQQVQCSVVMLSEPQMHRFPITASEYRSLASSASDLARSSRPLPP
jgi:Kef-type K+ transport system membrane component KefB/nucleotide-binding universal stress UspA family protein